MCICGEGKSRRRRLLVLGPDRIIFIIDRAQEQNKYSVYSTDNDGGDGPHWPPG